MGEAVPAPVEHQCAGSLEGDYLDLNDSVLRNPSLFGRLVGISLTQREPSAVRAAAEITELRQLHLETFINWLTLSVRSQTGDILIFLNSFSRTERPGKVSQLTALGQDLIPPDVKPPERELFLADLKIVQSVLPYEI